MKIFQITIKMAFFYMLSALGISLTIKANLGVSSYTAMNSSLSLISNLNIGLITTLVNLLFLIVFIIITSFKLRKNYLIQFIIVLVFGSFIDVFTYHILKEISLNNYFYRLLFVILGTCIAGFSIGMVMSFSSISFPIESVCSVISDKFEIPFIYIRYLVDLICIIVSVYISYSFKIEFFVREGTIINFLLLSFSISVTKRTLGKKLK